MVEKDLRAAYAIPQKMLRQDAVAAAKAKVMAHYFPEGAEPTYDKQRVAGVFKELEAKIVRWNILDTSKRIDGRDLKTVRQIVAEVGVLPRAHGSALFTRGETQALVVATLGTGEDEQYIDALQGTYKETFLLHYNFPPFSVGETGRIGRPRTPRNRPRQAGLARDPSPAAEGGGIPLHHPPGLRDHGVRTVRPRWPRFAARRWR